MFNTLTQKFSSVYRDLSGQSRLTEKNIQETLQEVRLALLDADVAHSVVESFIKAIESRSIGEAVLNTLTPQQTLIKIVYEELVRLCGEPFSGLPLQVSPPAVILISGLQGCGKTTTTAKLAQWLQTTLHKKILLTSVDIYRPAAISQLNVLANAIGAAFYVPGEESNPVAMAKSALEQATIAFYDVLLIDTAGRLHIDEGMMAELKAIHQAIHPIETLYVADGLTGQDAVLSAQAFHSTLPITGVILTKMDADTKGGAALSIRSIIEKPIKFLGVGEKTDALEPFHPERIASRILGMGDVLTLIEEAEQKLDRAQTKKFQKKLLQGDRFTLEDYHEQLKNMHALGGVGKILEKLPAAGQFQSMLADKMNDTTLKKMEVILCSMTRHEKNFPAIISGSRKVRISKGSGTAIQDINHLLKNFEQVKKLSQKFARKESREKLLRKMQNLF
ncbi:MAG: signal recognition particle protein [Gammaproteobacteria bacterium]|nr:signal recognition particle protein [Gammaproteobacteria bacterium]